MGRVTGTPAPHAVPSDPSKAEAYEIVAAVIRARRSGLAVDACRAVPVSVVEALCQLAQCAPNHKRTAPWRFAVVSEPARDPLGAVLARTLHASDGSGDVAALMATRYLRGPTVLIVGAAPGDSVVRSAENRDAVAAGIQNVLLAATALGLWSHWRSFPPETHAAIAEFCGFEPSTHISGAIHLGSPARGAMGARRPARAPSAAVRVL